MCDKALFCHLANLFLVMMDPLLQQLEKLSLGTSVNNFYTGGFLHADNIRTLSNSISTLEAQAALVQKVANYNFLKLNVGKYEVIVFSTDRSATSVECSVDGKLVPVGENGKCLGYWWRGDK